MKKLTRLWLSVATLTFCGTVAFTSCTDTTDNPVIPDSPTQFDADFSYEFDLPNDKGTVKIAFADPINTNIKNIGDREDWLSLTSCEVKDLNEVYDDGNLMLNAGKYLVVTLKYDQMDYESSGSDERDSYVYLMTKAGNTITIHVRQGHPQDETYNYPEYQTSEGWMLLLREYKGGSEETSREPNDEQKQFLTDWENMKEVTIYYSYNDSRKVPTPWNRSNPQNAFASELGTDVLKADGWTMVFSNLGYKEKGRNYFGLYNKELGVMRIFYYCDQPVTGTGNNYVWRMQLGNTRNRQSFYGTLPFGVPLNHKTISTKVNNEDIYTQAITPYHILNDQTLVPDSWNCFDIDMSSYTESPFSKNDNDMIVLRPYFTSQSSVTLESELTAKLDGKLGPLVKELTHQGMANRGFSANVMELVKFGKTGSTAVKDVATVIGKAWAGDFGGAAAGIGSAITSVKAAFKVGSETFAQNDWIEQVEEGNLKGSIDINLKGAIKTTGYISTEGLSSSIPIYSITSSAVQAGSNFGEGVWNLESDPELVVASDIVFNGTHESSVFNLPLTMQHWLRMGFGGEIMFAFEKAHWNYPNDYKKEYKSLLPDGFVPLVKYPKYMEDTFNINDANCFVPVMLDPKSLKVVINPHVFPNPQDIEINAYYGFFEDDEDLNIPEWRKALGLTCYIDDAKRPSVETKPVVFNVQGENNPFKSQMGGTMHFQNGKKADKPLLSHAYYKIEGAGKVFHANPWLKGQQPTVVNRYYSAQNYAFFNGSIGKDKSTMPNVGYYNNMLRRFLPDFNCYNEVLQRKCYVIVSLKFNANGKTYLFSRRYLPNIRLASYCDKFLENLYIFAHNSLREYTKEYEGMDYDIKYPLTESQIINLFNAFKNAEINKDRMDKVPEYIRKKYPVTDMIYIPWAWGQKVADWEKEEGM